MELYKSNKGTCLIPKVYVEPWWVSIWEPPTLVFPSWRASKQKLLKMPRELEQHHQFVHLLQVRCQAILQPFTKTQKTSFNRFLCNHDRQNKLNLLYRLESFFSETKACYGFKQTFSFDNQLVKLLVQIGLKVFLYFQRAKDWLVCPQSDKLSPILPTHFMLPNVWLEDVLMMQKSRKKCKLQLA